MIEGERSVPNPCGYVLVPAAEGVPKVTCREAAATVDFVNGFRCAEHPPRWDQGYAQFQRSIDRHGVADSYRRTIIALLGDRITARSEGKVNRRKPINHGTIGGNRAHYRHKVPMCEPCRDASRKARGSKPFHQAPCGTPAGYHRHRKLGEDCEACRKATTVVATAYRKARYAKGLPPDSPKHGTLYGYETAGCRCLPCRTAKSVANKAYKERRKAKAAA